MYGVYAFLCLLDIAISLCCRCCWCFFGRSNLSSLLLLVAGAVEPCCSLTDRQTNCLTDRLCLLLLKCVLVCLCSVNGSVLFRVALPECRL
ncbi:hypothetical protein BKA57DRAFT_449353, partial [Linnemannia elongata]